jgi:hypothetical protein
VRSRSRGTARRVALALVVVLGAAACSDEGTSTTSTSRDAVVEGFDGGTDETDGTGGTGGTDRTSAACSSEPGAPVEGPTATALPVDIDGVQVDLVTYPRPDYAGKPWSQWGQGIVLPDGRYLSAMGDHRGRDGNSFLFVYDPATRQMTRFADAQSVLGHDEGDWGYGKIHAQMVSPSCDSVYIATYWGTRRKIEYGGSYSGDGLMRLDPATMEVTSLGVPLERHGIPSMATGGGLIYLEAAVPEPAGPSSAPGAFAVYDPETEEVVYQRDDPDLTGFRSILVDADGAAYVAGAGSELLRYAPGGELATDGELPQGWLRAAAAPNDDGSVYGVSTDPYRFFVLRPDGGLEDIGPARGYTASIAVHPDGRILYVPGAHGTAWKHGTSVFAVDPETGAEETLVQLNATAQRELGLTLGGTYSVVVDPERDRLFIGFNAGTDPEDPWGEVVLASIEL